MIDGYFGISQVGFGGDSVTGYSIQAARLGRNTALEVPWQLSEEQQLCQNSSH